MSENFQGENTNDKKPITKENDILIEVYDPKETMYTDQTGKFPHVSSQRNRYMMVLAHIDLDSIWVEPMKNRTEGGGDVSQTTSATKNERSRNHIKSAGP